MALGYRTLVLVLVLLVPSVSGLSITHAWLEWQGHEVTTIAPGTPLPNTQLKIQLSEDFDCSNTTGVCALLLNSDEIPLSNRRVDVRTECIPSAEGLVCELDTFTLRTDVETLTITYHGQLGTDVGEVQTATISLVLDSTIPTVREITSGYCEEERCFIATGVPTPVTIEMEDTLTSYEYKLVFLGGNGLLAPAQECTGSSCSTQITVPCVDGETVTLGVVSAGGVSSREDAQNAITPGNAKMLTCVSEPPEIVEWDYAIDGLIDGLAVKGDTITVTALVRPRTIKTITASVDATEIVGQDVQGACAPAGDDSSGLLACTWTLADIAPGTFDLAFNVYDAIGNYATLDDTEGYPGVRITVLDLAAPPPEGLDYFSASVDGAMPEQLNRMAVELARQNSLPFPTYVVYTMDEKEPGATIISQTLDSCAYKVGDMEEYSEDIEFFSLDAQEFHVLYPEQGLGQNRLDLQVRAPMNVLELGDRFDVRCQLHLTVRDATTVYSGPEIEDITFSMTFRESALGQPGQAFVDRIKKEEDKLSGSANDFLLTLREVRATLEGVCTIAEGIMAISTACTAIEGVGVILQNIGGDVVFGAASALTEGGYACRTPPENFLTSAWYGSTGSGRNTGSGAGGASGGCSDGAGCNTDGYGWLRTLCQQVTCRPPPDTFGIMDNIDEFEANLYPSWVSGGGSAGTGSDFGDYSLGILTDSAQNSDISNSFIMSALHGCVGGMIYNAGKWQDINCGYLMCLKEQSLYGQSVSVCSQAKSYKECLYVVGEIFELPIIRVITNLAESIRAFINNLPAVLLSFFTNNYCTAATAEPCDYNLGCLACHFLRTATNIVDASTTMQRAVNFDFDDNTICLQALCDPETEDCEDLGFNAIAEYSNYADGVAESQRRKDAARRKGTKEKEEAQRLQNALSSMDKKWKDCTSCGEEGYTVQKQGEGYLLKGEGEPTGYLVGGGTFYSAGLVEPKTEDVLTGYRTVDGGTYISAGLLEPVRDGAGAVTGYRTEDGGTFYSAGLIEPQYTETVTGYWVPEESSSGIEEQTFVPADKVTVQGPVVTIEKGSAEDTALDGYLLDKKGGINEESLDMVNDPESRDALESRLKEGEVPHSLAEVQGTPEYTDQQYKETAGCFPARTDACKLSDSQLKDRGVFKTEDGKYYLLGEKQARAEGESPCAAGSIEGSRFCRGGDWYAATQLTGSESDKAALSAYDQQQRGAQEIDRIWAQSGPLLNNYYTQCTGGKAQNTCGAWKAQLEKQGVVINDDGTIKIGDKTYTQDQARTEARSSSKDREKQALMNAAVNYAVKWAYDEGYLNWLSLSWYGSWGRGAVDFTDTYLSKDAWARNLCNDLKFDLNNNDAGAIYISSGAFPQPVGTFAAEVREYLDGTETQYIYLLTISVMNPQLPAPPGYDEDAWIEEHTYALDARFTGEGEDFDLIDGTFPLAYGGTFGEGTLPKQALLYLPEKYDRICLTFDKQFPDNFGSREMCRSIKENVYERGSPAPPELPGGTGGGAGGSGGSAGGGSDGSTGTGCLAGSVSGC